MTIQRPLVGTYPTYCEKYVNLVKGDDIMKELLTEHYDTIDLITSIDLETQHYRYADDKWTIKEILQHVMDTERVYTYRAMCIARNDQTPFPGFDENNYSLQANAIRRDINDIAREMSVLRASTIELFKSFNDLMIERSGFANGNPVTVKSIMYMVLGHELHHRKIIETRYLNV